MCGIRISSFIHLVLGRNLNCISSLVLSLYVIKDKSQIATELIKEFASQLDKNAKGKPDFDELIKYLSS